MKARNTTRRKLWQLATISAVLLMLWGCGPGDALKAQTGHRCVVHFRGDYLGMASSTPFPPGTDEVNGSRVDMAGTLKGVDSDWLTLEVPGASGAPATEWVIPRDAVLMVSFDRGQRIPGSN